MNLINEKAPSAVTKVPLENYAGKVIACDASMAMYQFMIATQFNHSRPHMLTDDGGHGTAHLIGLFHRTIQLLDQNIKPIWVFDGKPPAMKSVELERRKRIKADAREQLKGSQPTHKDLPQPVYAPPPEPKEAKKERAPPGMASKQCSCRKKYVGQIRDLEMEFSAKHSRLIGKPLEPALACPDYCYVGESDEEAEGDARQLNAYFEAANSKPGQTPEEIEDVRKIAQRSLRVTKEMAEDAKLLLTLMGVPVIVAPSEAEAQCAALVKCGKAHAVVSEDMDSLAFGSNLLLRGLNSKKEPVTEISLERVLQEFDISHEKFVDLCILLGCDYCNSLSGIGPVTGYKLIQQFHTIENIVDYIPMSGKKWEVPTDFYFAPARELFAHPDVITLDDSALTWGLPDEAQLRTFLTVTKGFAPNKVETSLRRLMRLQGKPMQTKLDVFFGGKREGEGDKPRKRPKLGSNNGDPE